MVSVFLCTACFTSVYWERGGEVGREEEVGSDEDVGRGGGGGTDNAIGERHTDTQVDQE